MAGDTINSTVTTSVTLGSGSYTGPLYIGNAGFLNAFDGVALVIPVSQAGAYVLNRGTISPEKPSFTDGYNAVNILAASTLTNFGTIAGGEGGVNFGSSNDGDGLNGGVGIDLAAFGATVNNFSVVEGGSGGLAIDSGATGGGGGIGVIVSTGATVINHLALYGGDGGAAAFRQSTYTGGVGGIAISLAGGLTINDGNIQGGTGGYGSTAAKDGLGGIGVFISSGTLENSHYVYGGYQRGGTFAESDAVVFGSLTAGTLIVESGGRFFGEVVASTAVQDVLELGGTAAFTLSGVGTEFTGFSQLSFTNTGSFKMEGDIAGLASGQTISGFARGDQIILDDVTATGAGVSASKDLEIFSASGTVSLHLASGNVKNYLISEGANTTIAAAGTLEKLGKNLLELVTAGGTVSGATITDGTLDILAGGKAAGAISFSGTDGELILGASNTPGNTIDGFKVGDTIELAGIKYVSGASVSVLSNGTVSIFDGLKTFKLHIAGTKKGETDFVFGAGSTLTRTTQPSEMGFLRPAASATALGAHQILEPVYAAAAEQVGQVMLTPSCSGWLRHEMFLNTHHTGPQNFVTL